VQNAEECELALRREGGLGLVKEVKSILESVLEEPEKRLAVRLSVEGLATVSAERAADGLKIGCEVEEGLRLQKEATRNLLPPGQA